MNDPKNTHGGARPGAGRPPKAPVLVAIKLEHPATPASFLLAVMNDPDVDIDTRCNAAKALLPYFHVRAADQPKKAVAKATAEVIARGRFAPQLPPVPRQIIPVNAETKE